MAALRSRPVKKPAGALAFWLVACAAAVAQQPAGAPQTTPPPAQAATKPPATRAEAIEQERKARLANLQPGTPPHTNRLLIWGQNSSMFERVTRGYEGFRAHFAHMISGSGLVFGAGFFRQGLSNGSLNLGISADVSTRAFQRYEGEVGAPYLANKRLLLTARGLHLNYPSVDFYGFGPDSRQSGRTNYRLTDTSGDGVFGVRPINGLLVGASGGYAQFKTDSGTSSQSPSTTDVYTRAELPGLSQTSDFGRYAAFAEYDWLNRAATPSSGGYYLFQYTLYNNVSNRPYDFSRYDAGIEQYFNIFNQRRVFALRGAATLTDAAGGNAVPFYLQPTLGGAYTLRGFPSFRFTDNDALILTGEYRWEAFSCLDMALFVDAGKVFRQASQLNLHHLEYDGGFGLRFDWNHRVFLKLDVGFSTEGAQVWFVFGDVFVRQRLGAAGTVPVDY